MRDTLLIVRHRNFSLIWFAGLISMTGDWLLNIALPVYVFRLTGSPAATAAVVAVSFAFSLAAGMISGVLVDRWDRRRVLVVANLLQVAAIFPLVAVTSADRLWLVLVVAALEATLSQFVAPAEHTLLPQLVEDRDLPAANSLNTLNRNLARLVGPALGAVVAATLGLTGATLLDAASFAVAAGLAALVAGSHKAAPAVSLPRADRVGALTRWRLELGEGLSAVRASRVLRALLLVLLVTSVGEGIMSSLFAVFAARGLTGGAVDIGWLMSAQAVGGIVGGLGSAAIVNRKQPVAVLTTGLVAFGLVDLVIFNLPRFTPALLPQIGLFVLVGIPGAVYVAAAMTLLQREVGDALRGRVFAAFTMVQMLGALLGTGAAAAFTERLGVFTILTVQGAGYLVAAAIFGTMVRTRRRTRRHIRAVEVARLREPVGAAASVDGMLRRWNV